jgi:hypothetical protein
LETVCIVSAREIKRFSKERRLKSKRALAGE